MTAVETKQQAKPVPQPTKKAETQSHNKPLKVGQVKVWTV